MNKQHRIKSIIGGSIGNLVEWYDWFAYSIFSIYFAKCFFPSGSFTSQLLHTAAIFAIGFIMRPIGALVMGVYADRHGRKSALIISVLLMCTGSLMIALAPTYKTIGIISPFILLVARLIQGFSVGAEYGTSATYLSELPMTKHRGFYASFLFFTIILGELLALLVLIALQWLFLSDKQLGAWGWRIPFFIGALFAIIAFYLRTDIDETEAFMMTRNHQSRKNILADLCKHPRALFTVVGLTMGGTLAFYTYTTYMHKYLVNTSGFNKNTATIMSAATLFIFMLLQPVGGWLSDHVGRKPLLIFFGIFGTVCTVPLLTTLGQTNNMWIALPLLMAALIILTGYSSIDGLVKAELFPAQIRALGVGLPFAVTASLFGGSAEYIALWCKNQGHENWFFWYVTLCIAISLCVYIFMPDTKKVSCIDKDLLIKDSYEI